MESEQADSAIKCRVLAIPYPGRGHINPMMNFCKLLATSQPNILVTFIVTEEWQDLLSSDPKPANICFATIPNVIPSEKSRAKNFGAFAVAVWTKLEPEVDLLLDRIVLVKPSVILSDTFLTWALKIGQRRNIPVASFWTASAATFSIWYHHQLVIQNGHFGVNLSERGEELVDYIPGVPKMRIADLPSQFHGNSPEILKFTTDTVASIGEAMCLLFPTLYELEALAIDSFRAKFPIPIYAVGPAIPCFNLEGDPSLATSHSGENYFEWLNAQPTGSVLYIAQGSFLSVSSGQLDEIIAGVLDSGVRFLWIARDQDASPLQEGSGSIKGLVVPWCEQLKVLCHPSVGGFWTHCGWNSAAFAGVPMLNFPIVWDQFTNSNQIVEDWKIGWRVKRDHDNLATREEISELLKRLMNFESEERKEMRRKAQELREICRRATADGGSSYHEIEAFINNVSR